MKRKLSDTVKRKFIEQYNVNDYQIETDDGFVDIENFLVTIEYEKYYIKTQNGLELYCADEHILFDDELNEVFVKNLSINDKILTKYGVDTIVEVYSTNEYENMYDLQLCDDSKHRYYTNDILSHNTLIAKQLAKQIFGSERDLVRIDMSEYSEKSSVSKLLGSNPGYLGFENGGQLTEAVKHKQHCVLLLDEIEKADQEVYNIFLQLFDEGRLTDSGGQIVNFKNVIILMTSNIGAKEASELGGGVGFVNDENINKKTIIEKQLKKTFTPEFINRIDQIVYFNSLTDENLKEIVKLEIEKLNNRLKDLKYSIIYTDEVVDFIHELAIKQKEYGARPIIRLIQDNIEDKITDLLLLSDYNENYVFKANVENGKINIK